MNLSKRIELLVALGEYLKGDDHEIHSLREKAQFENKWFTPQYSSIAGKNIAENILQGDQLRKFADQYKVTDTLADKTVGLIMAGNIPYVGLHDIVCIILAGLKQRIKVSSKDTTLTQDLVNKMYSLDTSLKERLTLDDMLKGCDAYIATGSDNSARYFEFYFSKYPNIIRRNRTSVAILDGTESSEELEKLADDIQLYFGLGCRNVTQLLVPAQYDFIPLLNALRKYDHYREHDKYRNNLDYQLTIAIMNNRFYMTNDSVVLIENQSPFSPISQLHYQYYDNPEGALEGLNPEQIQCIVGHEHTPFGRAQTPGISDFADGVDTMEFLMRIRNC
jgi:hypothetical protein